MRVSAVSPRPTTCSGEVLGGVPRGQGLSRRVSIHRPISADLSCGQVVQNAGDSLLSIVGRNGPVPGRREECKSGREGMSHPDRNAHFEPGNAIAVRLEA